MSQQCPKHTPNIPQTYPKHAPNLRSCCKHNSKNSIFFDLFVYFDGFGQFSLKNVIWKFIKGAGQSPYYNLKIGRVYLQSFDPQFPIQNLQSSRLEQFIFNLRILAPQLPISNLRAKLLKKKCLKHAPNMPQTYPKHAPNMHQTCPKHAAVEVKKQ